MLIRYSIKEVEALLNECRKRGYEPKLEISFVSRYDYYVLKYGERLCFQRGGKEEDRSRVFYYDNFYDLTHDGTLDELLIEKEWGDVDYLSCHELDLCDLWNDINRDVYFEGEDFGNLEIKNKLFRGLDELWELFDAFAKCVRAETAHPDFQAIWREGDPTYGQSDVAAMLVQDTFGGDIYKMYVKGDEHYFNVVDGKTIDFARDHYEENVIPVIYDFTNKVTRQSLNADDRYELLKKRMNDYISLVME